MSLTEEDVRRIIGEHMATPRHDEVAAARNFAQWAVRAAYEECWNTLKAEGSYLESWKASTMREILVRQGFISGEDDYR